MNGNAAMVEPMADNTPDDALYDFERAVRLADAEDELLAIAKHLLLVIGQPVTAKTDKGRVSLLVGFDDVSHLLTRARKIVQHIEMGDPL